RTTAPAGAIQSRPGADTTPPSARSSVRRGPGNFDPAFSSTGTARPQPLPQRGQAAFPPTSDRGTSTTTASHDTASLQDHDPDSTPGRPSSVFATPVYAGEELKIELLYVNTTVVGAQQGVYFVVMDHFTRSCVIGFRGSVDLGDWITNGQLLMEKLTEDADDDETVHAGFLLCARTTLKEMEEKLDFPKFIPANYGIVCVGHSLGAGNSAAMGLLLSRKFPELLEQHRLRCLLIAPPGSVCSLRLAKESEQYMVSIINDMDGVPRARPLMMVAWRNFYLRLLKNAKLSKYEISQLSTKEERVRLRARLYDLWHRANSADFNPMSPFNVLASRQFGKVAWKSCAEVIDAAKELLRVGDVLVCAVEQCVVEHVHLPASVLQRGNRGRILDVRENTMGVYVEFESTVPLEQLLTGDGDLVDSRISQHLARLSYADAMSGEKHNYNSGIEVENKTDYAPYAPQQMMNRDGLVSATSAQAFTYERATGQRTTKNAKTKFEFFLSWDDMVLHFNVALDTPRIKQMLDEMEQLMENVRAGAFIDESSKCHSMTFVQFVAFCTDYERTQKEIKARNKGRGRDKSNSSEQEMKMKLSRTRSAEPPRTLGVTDAQLQEALRMRAGACRRLRYGPVFLDKLVERVRGRGYFAKQQSADLLRTFSERSKNRSSSLDARRKKHTAMPVTTPRMGMTPRRSAVIDADETDSNPPSERDGDALFLGNLQETVRSTAAPLLRGFVQDDPEQDERQLLSALHEDALTYPNVNEDMVVSDPFLAGGNGDAWTPGRLLHLRRRRTPEENVALIRAAGNDFGPVLESVAPGATTEFLTQGDPETAQRAQTFGSSAMNYRPSTLVSRGMMNATEEFTPPFDDARSDRLTTETIDVEDGPFAVSPANWRRDRKHLNSVRSRGLHGGEKPAEHSSDSSSSSEPQNFNDWDAVMMGDAQHRRAAAQHDVLGGGGAWNWLKQNILGFEEHMVPLSRKEDDRAETARLRVMDPKIAELMLDEHWHLHMDANNDQLLGPKIQVTNAADSGDRPLASSLSLPSSKHPLGSGPTRTSGRGVGYTGTTSPTRSAKTTRTEATSTKGRTMQILTSPMTAMRDRIGRADARALFGGGVVRPADGQGNPSPVLGGLLNWGAG
ncbi:unnamed protein product, partial [Amoebophrya sp. A120]